MTEPEIAIQAITTALDIGYRHIDTASLYANEKEVGEAVRNSMSQEKIFSLQLKFGIQIKDMIKH